MQEFIRQWRPYGLFCAAAVPLTTLLSGCGGDYAQTPPTTAAVSANAPAVTTLVSPQSVVPSSLEAVTVDPGLTPTFDPAISDYVVDCTSSGSVQFTAWLKGQNYFAFYGPDGQLASPGVPTNQFQQTVALKPGQRFRFSAGGGPEYSVRCLPADFPKLTVSVSGTRTAQWYLFEPTLFTSARYVIMTDINGTPVWWFKDPTGAALDAKVLGPNQIVWTTNSPSGSSNQLDPVGAYFFRNFAGQVTATLSGNLDSHDLQPTPTGTYLAIRNVQRVCPPDCADMSPWGGPAQQAVVDAEILELDSHSNVLWTWRTRDHISLAETGLAGWYPGVLTDIIHMNSLQVDGTDGVIFSARHLNAVYHITKSTGAIDWKLGGVTTPQSLTILNDTRPTANGPTGQPLSGQHDARLWPDGTVSVHDNGSIANRPPFVVRYQIDQGARTATVVEEFDDSRFPASPYTGSARRLPAGHWLVQWGAAGFMTEFDSLANPVFTVNYNLGEGFSYRAIPILEGTVAPDTLRNGMDAIAGN